jgi:hypothetical protein
MFRAEIMPLNQPALLKGVVRDWPAVRQALDADEAMASYLKRFDLGHALQILEGPPTIKGRFFYRDDMRGLNFERRPSPISAVLDRLLALRAEAEAPALYVESTPIAEHLPGFAQDNVLPLLPPALASPRIWIGNGIVVQTHFDLNDNIACVVAGRRRFTLFPPEQLSNLYVGPLDFTLSGPPVSMADPYAPDLARFPRFGEALAAAQVAELEPGDAIYIPYAWWHHVQSLERFNVLINYWWNETKPLHGAPFDVMLHAVMVLRDLPDNQRAAWRNMFDHYVFKTAGEPMAHLPPEQAGMMGAMSPERAREMRAVLLRVLGK